MADPNFSLLSQEEIDTLISFLTSKDKKFTNEVLDQVSIDKLIKLIQSNATNRVKFSCIDSRELSKAKGSDCLIKLGLRKEASEQCVLSFELQAPNNVLKLYITNQTTNHKELLTPKAVGDYTLSNDSSTWGLCISPCTFVNIAQIYDLSFTNDTYEKICKLFALVHYGSSSATIADLFLPNSSSLLNHII